jgi:two-component system, NtrC family, response regulator HydG
MQKIPARILVVDDDADILTAARVVLRQVYEHVVTEQNISKLDSLLRQNQFDVIMLDMNFVAGTNSGNEGLFWLKKIIRDRPDQKIILITAYADIQLAIDALKSGAADFIVKPWENEKLVSVVQSAIEARSGSSLGTNKNYTIQTSEPIIGASSTFKSVLTTIRKVAPTDANVLILGENGTGKELIARHIHELSNRKSKPFVKVDLGALVGTLFESELFGHKKGAFTDAREDRVGKFEAANGGTLFLDEIGNLSVSQQVKLLSVLQSRQFTPVGGNEIIPLDFRLVCATNLDVHKAVLKSEFREDLLYRINTIEIHLPPLRERKDDVILLAKNFAQRFSDKYNKGIKGISPEAILKLQSHSWQGNVRELMHSVERAVIMTENDVLHANDFTLSVASNVSNEQSLNMDELEHRAILQSIAKNNGNMSKVAKELGLGRTTLYRKLEKYKIQK